VDRIAADQIFLVGHSMGGLVIQSYIAWMITEQRAKELKKIRSVILFATPNRGSTIFYTVRDILRKFVGNPQEEDLQVLSEDMADVSDRIVANVLKADSVGICSCPLPFRVFWGMNDNIVKEVSARGPFTEASGLPGGHSEVIQPVDNQDDRFLALKDAILNPVGHPCIYEISLFDVSLKVSPSPPGTKITLDQDVKPQTFEATDKAIRKLKISFSKQNRCSTPYEQKYRSENGYVELLKLTEPNLASAEQMSEYHETSKKFTYLFRPEREATYDFAMTIYNGFGEGQRSWHNHMNPKANYKKIRFTLDIADYRAAGYEISKEPALYYYEQDTMDHDLCKYRVLEDPLPYVSEASNPWLRTWEISDIRGGVIDVVWDYRKP
jgi:hypothetical protein